MFLKKKNKIKIIVKTNDEYNHIIHSTISYIDHHNFIQSLNNLVTTIFHQYGYNTFEYYIYFLEKNKKNLIQYYPYYYTPKLLKNIKTIIITNYLSLNLIVNDIPYLEHQL